MWSDYPIDRIAKLKLMLGIQSRFRLSFHSLHKNFRWVLNLLKISDPSDFKSMEPRHKNLAADLQLTAYRHNRLWYYIIGFHVKNFLWTVFAVESTVLMVGLRIL